MNQAISNALKWKLTSEEFLKNKTVAVNAHATSTPTGDTCEWSAIDRVQKELPHNFNVDIHSMRL